MTTRRLKSLASLIRMDWEKAKVRLKRVGGHELLSWAGQPSSAMFLEHGIEVLLIETAKFCLPEEQSTAKGHCINAINFYSPDYCDRINTKFDPYQEKLWGNIAFCDSRETVRARLGEPAFTMDRPSRLDAYPVTETTLFQFYYSKDYASILYGSIVVSPELGI